MNKLQDPLDVIQLTTREYSEVCKLVKEHVGITLGDHKHEMLIARLGKRLLKLNISSFHDYIGYVKNPANRAEFNTMVDLVTTHETYFWREHNHFDWLVDNVIAHHSFNKPFKAWSAACSYGHEAYTLGILLHEYLHGRNYEILCSDISEKVLEVGKAGVYPEYAVEKVPVELRKKYFLKGVRSQAGMSRVTDDIRKRLSFTALNLKAIPTGIGPFDVVFLRNVLIYFDNQSKREIVDSVLTKIKPGGYLILAHSEALIGGHKGLIAKGRSIYQKEP